MFIKGREITCLLSPNEHFVPTPPPSKNSAFSPNDGSVDKVSQFQCNLDYETKVWCSSANCSTRCLMLQPQNHIIYQSKLEKSSLSNSAILFLMKESKKLSSIKVVVVDLGLSLSNHNLKSAHYFSSGSFKCMSYHAL